MRRPQWVEVVAVIALTAALALVAPDVKPRRAISSAPGPSLLRPAVAQPLSPPVNPRPPSR
jgi:hypothetical protein